MMACLEIELKKKRKRKRTPVSLTPGKAKRLQRGKKSTPSSAPSTSVPVPGPMLGAEGATGVNQRWALPLELTVCHRKQ